ncbi:MAG: DUF86 domain-containing protein [Deltaproteobacteria bacterium]|nr:DUF86 domain-containing protein [Deltaproteobacteria bacterium]
MLLAAGDAVKFVRGCTREQFDKDNMIQLATIKAIEIVGEAASRVSQSFRAQHTEIPWTAIAGMRHRLVHDYFNIDLDILWETANKDLPALIVALEPLVPPEES